MRKNKKGSHKGWYLLKYPEKFVKPKDNYMKSFRDISDSEGIKLAVEYKSGLEYKAFKYADCNPSIISWSVEPFGIKYIKPTDGKYHRYYIDLVVKFKNEKTFFIEVKPYSQTFAPRKPSGFSKQKATPKGINRYKNECMTYLVNTAKWDAAKNYCKQYGYTFITLTERELK
jgi:hypothetical protein